MQFFFLPFWSVRKRFSEMPRCWEQHLRLAVLLDCSKGQLCTKTNDVVTQSSRFKPFSPQTEMNSTWRNSLQKFPPCMHRAKMPWVLPGAILLGTQWGWDKVICNPWIKPSHSRNSIWPWYHGSSHQNGLDCSREQLRRWDTKDWDLNHTVLFDHNNIYSTYLQSSSLILKSSRII